MIKLQKLGIVVGSLMVLAACGNGDTDTNDEVTDNGTEGNGETEQLSGTIEVGVGEGYTGFIEEIAPAFEEEYGVEVIITERDMFDTLDALPLDGPAGLAPDVLLSPYDGIGSRGQQGQLAEITLPSDRYDEIDEQQVTVEGTIYGSPFVIESLVMYYNRDLLDEAPTTFEELEELAEDDRFSFAGEPGTSTAFLADWVNAYTSYGLISGYGGYVFGDDGKDPSDVGLNSPGAVEGIEYAQYWFQEIWPSGMLDTTSAGNFIDDQFIQGSVAAIINGPWGASNYVEAGVNFGVAPIPTLPNGNAYEPFAGGKGWIIPSYSENIDAAQAFIDFVNNEENTMLLYTDYTREIPANQNTRNTILEDGEDELAIAVIEQYNNAVPMPNIPEMSEYWEGAESMMFDAGSGNQTAQEAADNAVEVIKTNIEQIYN